MTDTITIFNYQILKAHVWAIPLLCIGLGVCYANWGMLYANMMKPNSRYTYGFWIGGIFVFMGMILIDRLIPYSWLAFVLDPTWIIYWVILLFSYLKKYLKK